MPDDITPLAEGGVLLEWDSDASDDEFSIDISPSGEFGYSSMTTVGGLMEFDEEDNIPIGRAVCLVQDFLTPVYSIDVIGIAQTKQLLEGDYGKIAHVHMYTW